MKTACTRPAQSQRPGSERRRLQHEPRSKRARAEPRRQCRVRQRPRSGGTRAANDYAHPVGTSAVMRTDSLYPADAPALRAAGKQVHTKAGKSPAVRRRRPRCRSEIPGPRGPARQHAGAPSPARPPAGAAGPAGRRGLAEGQAQRTGRGRPASSRCRRPRCKRRPASRPGGRGWRRRRW